MEGKRVGTPATSLKKTVKGSCHSPWRFVVMCWCWSDMFSEIFREILEHFVLPSADKFYVDAHFILQQDSVPAHTCLKCQTLVQWAWCYYAWLASNLTMNPTENLWAVVKRKMRDTNNTDDLKAAIEVTWAFMTPMHGHRGNVFMPHCIHVGSTEGDLDMYRLEM